MAETKRGRKSTKAVTEEKVSEVAAVEEAPEEVVVEAAPAVEAPKKRSRKPAAKKAEAPVKAAAEAPKKRGRKPAAKTTKTAAVKKTAAASENVYIQYNGAELTSAGLIERAKSEAGVKSPKKVDVYVKPEENMVYYVVDTTAGSFSLS